VANQDAYHARLAAHGARTGCGVILLHSRSCRADRAAVKAAFARPVSSESCCSSSSRRRREWFVAKAARWPASFSVFVRHLPTPANGSMSGGDGDGGGWRRSLPLPQPAFAGLPKAAVASTLPAHRATLSRRCTSRRGSRERPP